MKIVAKQGQTWDMISKQAYGNEFYTQELMLENPSLCGICVFEGGEEIEVPELEEEVDSAWN